MDSLRLKTLKQLAKYVEAGKIDLAYIQLFDTAMGNAEEMEKINNELIRTTGRSVL